MAGLTILIIILIKAVMAAAKVRAETKVFIGMVMYFE